MKIAFLILLVLDFFVGQSQPPANIHPRIEPLYEARNDSNFVFTTAEKPPEFPAGKIAWREFIIKNLNPNVPIDKGARDGSYKAIIKFVIDRQGNLKDFVPLTDFGFGMEEEVIRMLKASPNWTPAEQNGQRINFYMYQPITFIVSSK